MLATTTLSGSGATRLVALEPVRPAISERVGPLAGPPAPPTFEPLVTALINDVVGDPAADEGLLVLDDYHLIRSEAVHASIGFLLEHRPPQLHVVLASRSDPPLPLARLRARGELAEVRAPPTCASRSERRARCCRS